MDSDPLPLDYRSPEWVAERLGLEKNTVYKFLKEGRLPGLQIGRKWLISEKELASFLEVETAIQTASRQTGTEAWLSRIKSLGRNFSGTAIQCLVKSREFAIDFGHSYIGQEHILLAILYSSKSPAYKLLAALGLDPAALRETLLAAIERDPEMRTTALDLTKPATEAIRQAAVEAKELGHNWIGAEHLILGMLAVEGGFGHEFLAGQGLSKKRFLSAGA